MKVLYLDCSISGISGDMTLAALIGLGADIHEIVKQLQSFPIESFELKVEGVIKKGIYSNKITVEESVEHPPVHHRHFSMIKKMITESEITDRAKQLALAIFEPIADAEAKIHHSSIEKVHFHEVGAVDSIVDAVGIAIALDQLEVDRIIASPVVVGSGSVNIDHGRYPIPAPATLEILKGIPIKTSNIAAELTTPTGAGVLKGLVTDFGPIPSMIVEQISYGAGTKDFEKHPNVLRAILGTPLEK